MADVFGYERDAKPAAVFSNENAKLYIVSTTSGGNPAGAKGLPGGGQLGAKGYLVQNWNVTYAQQVQEVFELGSNAIYWVKGRPTGTGTLARVVGPRDAVTASAGGGAQGIFPKEAFDLCEGGALFRLTVSTGRCAANTGSALDFKPSDFKEVQLTMDGVIITQIGFAADVNDTRVIENVQWRFSKLDVS